MCATLWHFQYVISELCVLNDVCLCSIFVDEGKRDRSNGTILSIDDVDMQITIHLATELSAGAVGDVEPTYFFVLKRVAGHYGFWVAADAQLGDISSCFICSKKHSHLISFFTDATDFHNHIMLNAKFDKCLFVAYWHDALSVTGAKLAYFTRRSFIGCFVGLPAGKIDELSWLSAVASLCFGHAIPQVKI